MTGAHVFSSRVSPEAGAGYPRPIANVASELCAAGTKSLFVNFVKLKMWSPPPTPKFVSPPRILLSVQWSESLPRPGTTQCMILFAFQEQSGSTSVLVGCC